MLFPILHSGGPPHRGVPPARLLGRHPREEQRRVRHPPDGVQRPHPQEGVLEADAPRLGDPGHARPRHRHVQRHSEGQGYRRQLFPSGTGMTSGNQEFLILTLNKIDVLTLDINVNHI